MLGYAMLRMCDGCKDVLDTDQDGSSVRALLAPFRANGAHRPIGCAPIARKGERSPFYSTHHSHAEHILLHCQEKE